MSYFIGIRDFPIIHRQLSSPPNRSLDVTASSQELAQDSKDVLVQRIHDLAKQVVLQNNLNDQDFTALHADMDRMERLLHRTPKSPQTPRFPDHQKPASVENSRDLDDDDFWSPFSSKRIISRPVRDQSTKTSPTPIKELPEISREKLALLAEEAESLLSSLSGAIKELQARKEESDHIHDILVSHAEKAAQRVMALEEKVRDMDADFEANQSELSYLRIQLRALEVQGLQHIPLNADDELTQSIQKWKRDWTDVDQRTKAKRKKVKALVDASDSSQIISDGSG